MKSFDRRIEREGEFQLHCALSNNGWAYENLQKSFEFLRLSSKHSVLLQIRYSNMNAAPSFGREMKTQLWDL